MAYSIEDFKSVMTSKNGLARSNLFKVTLPPISSINSRELTILCKSVQLPGRQIMTNERRIGLESAKVAYGYANVEVSMTFYETNQYDIRKYFEAWQNLAVNQQTKEIGYLRGPNGYGKDITIEQLKKPTPMRDNVFATVDNTTVGDVVYKCKLIEAFPTTLTQIDLSDASDTLVETTVSLSYTNWFEI